MQARDMRESDVEALLKKIPIKLGAGKMKVGGTNSRGQAHASCIRHWQARPSSMPPRVSLGCIKQ